MLSLDLVCFALLLAAASGRPGLGPRRRCGGVESLAAGGVVMSLGMLLITMASGFSPVTNALMLEVNPPALTGVGVGIANFSAYAFVALFSSVVCGVLDRFHLQAQVDAAGSRRGLPFTHRHGKMGLLTPWGCRQASLRC
jgi:hypothetical protein